MTPDQVEMNETALDALSNLIYDCDTILTTKESIQGGFSQWLEQKQRLGPIQIKQLILTPPLPPAPHKCEVFNQSINNMDNSTTHNCYAARDIYYTLLILYKRVK